MINLCTCTGGSASNKSSSKRRSGPLSCKNCGGRSSIHGKSPSSCLLSTVLELTSLINSDFTWTKVSKGCRSSSRRPRSSNTINLTNHSKVLEMPVSESEKLGVSVLGCHFSEKAEHIPIKKRRFLFRASSPPRHETSPRALNQEIKVNPNPTCVPEPVPEVVKKEIVKAKHEPVEDDFSGISILAAAACSNSLGAEADRHEGSGIGIGIGINASVTKSPEPPTTTEIKENISKSAKEESDSHTSKKRDTQPASESAIPTPKDVRFNWDLNTVMDDAWEEPEHEVSAHNTVKLFDEKKEDCTNVSSRDRELGSGMESGIPLKDTGMLNEKELKLGSNKQEPSSNKLDNAQHIAVAESAIPVTKKLTMENPTPGIFSKWATHGGKISSGTDAVDTKLSMDCSAPPGFDQYLNMHALKENVAAESAIPVTTQPSINVTCKPEQEKNDLSLTHAASVENGALLNKVDEPVVKMEIKSDDVSKQKATVPCVHDSGATLENGIGYDNTRGGSGYDSQYEDGELRESNGWKGEEHEYVADNRREGDVFNVGITDSHEPIISSPTPCIQDNSSPRNKLSETDLTSSAVLPEKLHNTDAEVLTGSEPNEMVSNNSNSNQTNSERQEVIEHVNQSDEWKMNVSGLDHGVPEYQRVSSSNFSKTRNFTGRKFSYGEQKDGFDPEDVDTKGEGSRFYRKEPITRIGSSTRDGFLTRGRFRVQGCSANGGEGLGPRQEREVRSFGRGRYSPPHTRVWNRSPERKQRLPSPTYQAPPPFLRNILEDSGTLDNNVEDPNESNRPNTSSYLTRRQFRSRSPMNREANDFRARLGLRPTTDTNDHRFNMGRGRGRGRVGYGSGSGSRVDTDGPGPRRFHGPGSDECDEFISEYPNPFPRRRRCFSPVERRGDGNGNRYSDSRSPSRPRTRSPVSNSGFRRRSRSPSFRIRRPRSPSFREYNSGPRSNNSSPPPNSRWVNYKERPPVFDRRSSPPLQERERGFYERKPKQNEFYRSGQQPGRFDNESGRGSGRPRYDDNGSETDRGNNGYRRGGFVRRFNNNNNNSNNMDGNGRGHVKRFHYDGEDGFGRGFDARDKHALEAHARGNLKTSNGTTSSTDGGGSGRFRDFSKRSREDKEMVGGGSSGGGEYKRRSREPKEKEQVVKDESNLDSIMPNQLLVTTEGDTSKSKPSLGSN